MIEYQEGELIKITSCFLVQDVREFNCRNCSYQERCDIKRFMGKIGVIVDRPSKDGVSLRATLVEVEGKRIYLFESEFTRLSPLEQLSYAGSEEDIQ